MFKLCQTRKRRRLDFSDVSMSTLEVCCEKEYGVTSLYSMCILYSLVSIPVSICVGKEVGS